MILLPRSEVAVDLLEHLGYQDAGEGLPRERSKCFFMTGDLAGTCVYFQSLSGKAIAGCTVIAAIFMACALPCIDDTVPVQADLPRFGNT